MIGLPAVNGDDQDHGQVRRARRPPLRHLRGQERLVTRGQYRLLNNQKGELTFQLNGNAYKFAKGHTVELELLGQDPNYMRKSNGTFAVSVSKLTVALPTREKSKPL